MKTTAMSSPEWLLHSFCLPWALERVMQSSHRGLSMTPAFLISNKMLLPYSSWVCLLGLYLNVCPRAINLTNGERKWLLPVTMLTNRPMVFQVKSTVVSQLSTKCFVLILTFLTIGLGLHLIYLHPPLLLSKCQGDLKDPCHLQSSANLHVLWIWRFSLWKLLGWAGTLTGKRSSRGQQ